MLYLCKNYLLACMNITLRSWIMVSRSLTKSITTREVINASFMIFLAYFFKVLSCLSSRTWVTTALMSWTTSKEISCKSLTRSTAKSLICSWIASIVTSRTKLSTVEWRKSLVTATLSWFRGIFWGKQTKHCVGFVWNIL